MEPGALPVVIWPLPNVAYVTPPDGTRVRLSDVATGSGPGVALSVLVSQQTANGVTDPLAFRYDLDGIDITPDMRITGTEGGGQVFYQGTPGLGDHTASVSYCDDAGQPYEYVWRFTIFE